MNCASLRPWPTRWRVAGGRRRLYRRPSRTRSWRLGYATRQTRVPDLTGRTVSGSFLFTVVRTFLAASRGVELNFGALTLGWVGPVSASLEILRLASHLAQMPEAQVSCAHDRFCAPLLFLLLRLFPATGGTSRTARLEQTESTRTARQTWRFFFARTRWMDQKRPEQCAT